MQPRIEAEMRRERPLWVKAAEWSAGGRREEGAVQRTERSVTAADAFHSRHLALFPRSRVRRARATPCTPVVDATSSCAPVRRRDLRVLSNWADRSSLLMTWKKKESAQLQERLVGAAMPGACGCRLADAPRLSRRSVNGPEQLRLCLPDSTLRVRSRHGGSALGHVVLRLHTSGRPPPSPP